MRVALLVLLPLSFSALAENTLTDQERQFLARQQQVREAIIARARARCIEGRGVDCSSEQGLYEWALLDRTREQAVLDTLRPMEPYSAGFGGTAPPTGSGASTPATSR